MMVDSKNQPIIPRKILFATDLSARCDRALDRTALLAEAWGAEIVLVHALEQTDDFYENELKWRVPSWRRSSGLSQIVKEQLRHDLAKVPANVTLVVEKGAPEKLV